MSSKGGHPLWVASPYVNWGPSYRVRVEAWLDRTGIPHTLVANGRPKNRVRSQKFSCGDLRYEVGVRFLRRRGERVLVQKAISRLGLGSAERSFRNRFDNLVFDLDDAVFLPSHRTILGSRSSRVAAILCTADRVIAGNEYLADYCSNFVDDVLVIPTCIEPSEYAARREPGDCPRLTVGWLGSGSTAHYVEAVLPALAAVQRDLGVRVVMIGAEGPDVIERHSCVIERFRWSKSTEAQLLASLDVGIVPLRDTPWEEGKCAYKLLQYGAVGLAAIGSPVGVVGAILDSAGAPTASTHAEWEASLRYLLSSEEARLSIGNALQSHVLRNYSYSRWQSKWMQAVGA